MKRSRLLMLVLAAILVTTLFAGCKKDEEQSTPGGTTNGTGSEATNGDTTEDPAKDPADEPGGYEDGTYFAVEEHGANWRGYLIAEVNGGQIESVIWSGASINGGTDKYTRSVDGFYGMVARGGAISEWHVQADEVTNYVVENQTLEPLEYDEDGYTDTIAGVTIRINGFYDLLSSAFASGPVERGPYKDGAIRVEQPEFSRGWKATLDLTIANGHILAANWNAISEEDPDFTKKDAVAAGEYEMPDAIADWTEQARAAESAFLAAQDVTALVPNADGYTDTIAGVSVRIGDFYALAQEALELAK